MNRRGFLRFISVAIASAALLPKRLLFKLGEKVGLRGSLRIIDNPGTVWFLSDNGDDDNDGLTPETAKRTLGGIPFQAVRGEEILYLGDNGPTVP